MNREGISKAVAAHGRDGRAKKVCMGLVVMAGVAIYHPAWADDWQTSSLGQPVVWQQGGPTAAGKAPTPTPTRKQADFKDEKVSEPARKAANWVVDSGDNQGMPFMIVDKAQAKVLMFDAKGQLSGAASALLGLAVGDDTVPGIGERRLSSMLPEERTTPAGRFVASLGRNLAGKDILWIDYDAAISLHRVVTGNVRERRAERLASPRIDDKRISYGCINVPPGFFDSVVIPAFTGTNGVVYTLPETRDNHAVFNSYYEHESK
ncbi:hypothetical protein [Pseudomonas saliphila]|uniref:hypothetical protein n=1 Tax=Pseudomonas saliphila TaxID=2586906 RepID=UPI001F484018|nr:hypothetical protein [Pseudomonas saliphila]